MFWDRFYQLCISNNSKPNPIAKDLGISSAVLTKWKNGVSYPNGEVLINIARYFDCSIDYLVGLSDEQYSHNREISSTDKELLEKLHFLSEHDKKEVLNFIEYKIYTTREKDEKSSLSTKKSDSSERTKTS